MTIGPGLQVWTLAHSCHRKVLALQTFRSWSHWLSLFKIWHFRFSGLWEFPQCFWPLSKGVLRYLSWGL